MTQRITIIPPNDAIWHALRSEDVTSTESSALFGMSPYATAFELWHRKHDKAIVEIEDNERMRWGRRLQDAIAYGIAEDNGWVCEPMKEYIRLNDARMGSSFDFKMIDSTNRIGVFEIKNVDYLVFRDKWTVEEDGNLTAPEHIEIQLQHQLHVSGYEWGAIGVLVAGNSPRVLIRERDEAVGKAIEKRIRAFWKSIEEGKEPAPTFPGDADFLASLYKYAEPGKVLDARGDAEITALCAEYASASERAKLADEDKKTAKAKLLAKIGEHERCMLDGYTITAGMVGPTFVSYTREGYRNFRVTAKKEKVAA
jgi:putative phage-type endonuclease